ncbi:Uncharacterised protein [uncultured Eubacterium sp.]|jgi:hypothetical protein|nr:Uncharacterised protein [uncultured Eubacterium sp.]
MTDFKLLEIAKKYTDKKVGSSSPSTPSTSNYDDLKNKPSINGKELTGNLSSDEIGVSSKDHNHDEKYASKDSEHAHSNKEILDSITKEKIEEWDKELNITVTDDGTLVID